MRGRHLRPLVTVGLAALLLLGVGAVLGARSPAPAGPQPVTEVASATGQLDAAIERAQQRLRRVPGDYLTWAALGSAYLERARITADPSYYELADGALRRSLAERPDGNPDALVGLGALANALHDFAEARALAQEALELNPYDADAYGVLADAETQLGNPDAATEAVQRMLDLRPSLPAYARASYDLEQRGRIDEARSLMEYALAAAFDPADIAFCHYQLGELAWHAGDLAEAEAQYRAGVAAAPNYLPLRQGLAKVAAARGDLPAAIAGYAELTAAAPTPDYLMQYAELLRAAGREAEAGEQLALAEAAHELFLAAGGADHLTGAELAIARDRPEEALRLAELEWEQRQFTGVADTLGWALHLNDRDEEALAYAGRANALGAQNATYAYHLGMIRFRLGDREAARAELARALDINPYFSPWYAPRAARTLQALES
ncbi:MAG TPA: tetratricopeptide repeat protein [Natronosporangium sp.]